MIRPFIATLLLLCLGAAVGLSAQSGDRTASYQLASPQEVTDLSAWPQFANLWYFPLVANPYRTRYPEGFVQLTSFTSSFERVTDEDGEEEFEPVYFAEYYRPSEFEGLDSERGLLSFKLAVDPDDAPTINGRNIVGFLQRPTRFEDLPQETVDGLFRDSTGTLQWESEARERPTTVTMDTTLGGEAKAFADETEITVRPNNPSSMAGFSFPIEEIEDELLSWSFGSVTFQPLGDQQTYYSFITRTDGLETDDVASLNLGTDPDLFWNRWYIFLAVDPDDRDGDGRADLVDPTDSFTTAPFYADLSTSEDWFWSWSFLAWIFSDRVSRWDYAAPLGWYYVPDGANWSNFWFYHVGQQSWLLTNRDWFPRLWRARDDVFLEYRRQPGAPAVFYNYATEQEEPVLP